MYGEIITGACSILAGGVVARVTALRSARSPRPTPLGTSTREHDDPDDDSWIDEAAEEWARQHGRLEAAPLLAAKLHLSQTLRRQPKTTRRWTWSRHS